MLPGNFLFRNGVSAAAILPGLLLFWLVLLVAGSTRAAETFPQYPSIMANVAFWEKIYSTYSVNSAVIHDRNDLSKVYEVVQLMDPKLPAAARVNSALIDIASNKWRTILKEMANGKAPASVPEQRAALLFQGSNSRQHMALAAESVRVQMGQKEQFLEGVVRSGRYLPAFKSIFRAHGLPVELAYLPHVESSFNSEAYSKAGASGMWQFTLGTGKRYMRIDDASDERSDPFIAAEAAARYLRDSYQKLGNWPLALTAYNYGTAGMVRAQDAKGSYERIFREYREGNFGFASQNFYAEFLAALRTARNLEASPQVQCDKPMPFIEYALPGYIHIKDVRRHFKVSDIMLKQFNPALRPAVYSGSRLMPEGYRLRLPAEKNTRALIARIPRSYFNGRQAQDRFHQVRPGETLSHIAVRHGLSVSALASANGLKSDARVKIGQRLRIPPKTTSSSKATSQPALSPSQSKRLARQPVKAKTVDAKSTIPLVLSAETMKIERISAN